jgi:hypothetical protein
MSRAFLILTTQPPPVDTDPSERTAILAARREEALEARAALAAVAAGQGAPASAEPPRTYGRRPSVLAFVDRLGRIHTWPGLLRERRAR